MVGGWLTWLVTGWPDRLMRLVALAMDLDESFFEPFFTDPIVVLRGHYYTPTASDPSRGIFAAGSLSRPPALRLLPYILFVAVCCRLTNQELALPYVAGRRSGRVSNVAR